MVGKGGFLVSVTDLDQNQWSGLLQMAAQKSGMSADQLKSAAENGSLAGMLGDQTDPELLQALNDPQAAQRLLANPQVQKLLQQLLQKGS